MPCVRVCFTLLNWIMYCFFLQLEVYDIVVIIWKYLLQFSFKKITYNLLWRCTKNVIRFLSRLRRKFNFWWQMKCRKATFFRPAGGKVRIPIVPGGKAEIPKSFRRAHHAHLLHNQIPTSITVLTKQTFVYVIFIHITTSLHDALTFLLHAIVFIE